MAQNQSHMREIYRNIKYDNWRRFIRYWSQIQEILKLNPRKVLEVGKGNGFVSDYLKKRGIALTTLDCDQTLEPDILGDIRKLPFQDNQFDVVSCYEVLEHLPFSEFNNALKELHRVSSRYVLLSIPQRIKYCLILLQLPFFAKNFKKLIATPFYRYPKEKISKYHYWEIDRKEHSKKILRKIIQENNFQIIFEGIPHYLDDWHYFFVLKKK